MNDKDYLRGDPFKDVHAWEDNRQMIPFQPTAVTATSSQDSPYFMDYKKLQEQKEYERKIKAGQIFPKYLGNNQFAVENNPFADTEAFVESGPEWQQKAVGSIGWGEQSNKSVDAVLNFLDGKSNTYNWNPSVYGDPSNAWNEWSYWGEVGTGISKIFSTPENRIRMQSMLDRMDQRDPNFDEATRLRLTDEFLKSNPEVARYLGTAGVDLYDYTASAVSDLGLRFRIHQAVVDSLQNIKLGEFANTYKGYEQVGEALKNGIADPSLVRDLAITTALTLGLGTIQVGASSLSKSLGQASVIGARAMAVARASAKALQLTSPFTGLAEGVAYAGIRAVAPTVGKSALATTLARTGAIATEAGLQSVLSAYEDQRHEYEWRSLIFRGKDDAAFKPDWQQIALQGAIGAGMGTAMMGIMRFAVGGFGDLKYIRQGGWEAFKKNLAGSFDTWARTTEGLTVWGDRLSEGRGVLFGDMIDNYMARSVDNRNLSNIMVNGQRLFSRTVFNPTVAAKASFNMDEASKFANIYAETLGLPAEYVQELSPTSIERVLFDNLTDPEYLSNAGLTYKEASEILQKYKDMQDKVVVLPEADPVMAKLLVEAQGNPKLAAKLQTDNRLLALADIFDIDYVNKQLQRAGVSFETVNNLWKKASGGSDLNFGNKIDRDAYRELGRFAANGNKWAYNIQERLKYIDPIRSTPLKVGDAEIGADTLRTALRAALDLDGENRKGRSLFLTDGFLDKDPTGIVEITPDGIVKVHQVTPEIGDGGKIVMRSDAFDHSDYTPENIMGMETVNQTFNAWKNNVMVELKKLEDEAKVKVDEEIEESVPAEVFAELGKAPTKQVLMRHFDLSGPEATVASMVMETMGLDIKKVVLKIIRARGKTLQRMEAGKAVGAIEWRDIKSGVAALISTSKGADFGTLVHEMGHYNRMLFIGDSAEHVEFRHKLGITDDAWNKFTNWLGYDGPWENDVTKMTPEQRNAEEKFANAWAYYIRSIMFGDGKTNDSSLHRLFSAFGDHLGEMGKKMQTQDAMDKTMNFDVFAKAVYDKLFLRSEGRVTEFWESAVNGVFKNIPQADRERLGEAILGTELWNSHKAKIQKDKLDAEAKIAPLTPKVTRVSRSDIAKSLKGKMSGEGLSPSQKSIRAALKDGKSLEDIEKETRELWAKLQSEDQTVWEDNPALRPTSDMSIKGHVANLTDAQLLALPEGHRLKPINGVVRLVYNPDTKRMDVGFPVLFVTQDKINREIISRKARADALKRLRESRPKAADPVVAAENITSDPIVEATTIDVPMREEPTNTIEGIPSTEQTIVHDVVDAVESANLGVRELDGTPVLEVTPDEAVEHTMQITQQETIQESMRDMNEVVPNPSTSEPEVVAQAVTVRDNARAELETLQQNLPVKIATTAVVVASARRATNTSVVELLRNIMGNEPIPAEVIKTIEDYSAMDDRFLNILIKTEGTGGLTQQEVDDYMALPPDVIRKLEDSDIVNRIQSADDAESMTSALQQQTGVSMQQMNSYVVYTTKLQEARKTMTTRKLQKQLDDNKVKYERYTKLQAIENKTPENLQEMKSLEVAAGKYREAAKQLGLIDETKIVRQRVDEDFATFIYSKTAERKKTEMLVGRAKPNTIVTDEDFAVRLIANDEILVRLMRIANAADSNPEQILSNIYRDGNFIDWFKRTMNVKDLTNEETFNLVLAWAKKEQDFPQLSKSLKTRAKTKAKENAAALKGTKKQISSRGQTEEGVGIFEKTAGKELTDRSDQAADALISLFVNHLKSKQSKLKEGKGTLSLADYFMARRQLAEVPGNKAIATAKMIKEATGIEISENTVKNLNAKIEKETDTFFKDIVDDPDLGKFAEELIEERFGIKVRKTKEKPATTKARELLQSPIEEQVGNDLRKAMNKGDVKNAKQALEYIRSSGSQFSSIADFLSKNANQETLRRMPVLLLEENVKYRARKDLPVWRQVSFKKFVEQTGGQYIPTLHLVGINNDQRGLNVTSIALHEIVHGLTNEYILTKLGIDPNKIGQDWLNNVRSSEATATGWVKKLLAAYLEAVDDGVNVDGIKFLNDPSQEAFDYWGNGAGYGLQNLEEFLSETLSSPSFMGWLLMTPDKTTSYPEWTYLDLFNTMRQDSDWMGAVHLKADQNLLDVLTEIVKVAIADMSAVQRQDAAANWRLKKIFQALAVERHAKAAKRVNKKDPLLLQSQKAIADLKASKGRLYQGLREKAVYEMTLDEIFETPEFKDWFSDSKVIDTMGIYKPGSGKPMIMYHGSKYAGFTKFRNPDFSKSRSDQLYGAGIYLTDDPGIASSYTAKESIAVMKLLSGEAFFIPKNAKPSRNWFENSTFGRIVKESVTNDVDAQAVFSRVYWSMQQLGEDTERFWSDFEKAINNLNKPRILSNLNTLWTAMNNTSMELGYPKYDKLWKRFESEMDYLDGNLIVLEDLGFKRLAKETGEGVYPVFVSIQKPADVDNDLFSISDLVKRLETKLKEMEDVENPETIGEWEKLKAELERASEVASLSSPSYNSQGYYLSNSVYWRYPDKSAPSINKFLENPKEWWNSDLNPFKTKLRKVNLNEKETNKIIEDTWETFVSFGNGNYSGIMSPDERLVEAIRNKDSYHIQELVDSLEESFIEMLLEFEDARVEVLSTSSSNRNFASTLYDGLDFIFSDTPTEDRITLFKLFPILRSGKVDHLMIQLLQTMEYDGLTHIGGQHMGKKDHRVFIAWENTQVKSKFNKGGFGRTKSNLLLQNPPDVQPLIDAVDLRRRKLKELGLNEEMDAEELNMIGRILNGLDPVDVSTTTILDRVGSTFTPSQLRKISSAFDGTDYRSLSDNERRTFILESVIPKIRAAMGDRNSTNGFYSAFSSSDMGKRVNSLIGGAVDYGDTADSNSVFIQFISKIFDPLMDMRDGELMNKFEMPSVDRINAERSNILLRTGLTRFTDKIAATVKDFNSRKAINDTAWLYLTRPNELPKDIAHRDLILEAIQVVNEFNRIRVELLQSNKMLSKNLDYRMYGTSHRANRFAEANQAAFVDAMNAMFVKRTRESNQISIVTAAALGWVDLKRNTATDDIMAIRIAEDSPLAKLMPEEKLLGKWVDWEGRIRKAFDDKTILPKDIQDIHDKGLVSIDDYTETWKNAYASKVDKPYTALRQAAEIAKNRYLGIDFGDSKASSPRRQSIGEGRNYNEERIFTHDEIVRDPNLSKFFRNDMFGLMNDDINTQILDAMMTRDLTKFFGVRMSMTDLMEILATTGEEIAGRQGISQAEVESRIRGYERLRNSWNRAIGIIDSDKDSIDKYAKVVLRNSRIPLTLASSLRAAVTSLPELARALLTSNKNKPMLMQFLPNMVKLAKGVGKNRRQAQYQIMSGIHWLRGLATDHILLRENMDPENPFGGTVFGENAGGMASNFVNGWRVAGERNKYETNWLQRVANRLAPISSAVGAPLTFVNDMSTLLHIWNAQENITTNLASFRKMAVMLEKDPTTDMAKFAAMAKKCGLSPQEAINLSTTGLLKTKYIDILSEAAKNQTLYSDGILDTSKLYAWAGDNPERLEAISMLGGYINTTSRLTNVEPTLLDIRVGQSLFGLVMRQYMQFFLSMGVQEIGRRRRSTSVDYTKHLVGLLLMEIVAYGTSRALADPTDDNMGGIDEFEKNPLDYTVRTISGMPLLGSYAWLSQIMRHTVMGASELMGGPGAEQEFRLPDLLGGPASSAPRRLGNIPDTAAAYYQALQDMISD